MRFKYRVREAEVQHSPVREFYPEYNFFGIWCRFYNSNFCFHTFYSLETAFEFLNEYSSLSKTIIHKYRSKYEEE